MALSTTRSSALISELSPVIKRLPLTVRLPSTDKLSATVVSEVEWPNVNTDQEIPVPIATASLLIAVSYIR